jgi:hypothetical protein
LAEREEIQRYERHTVIKFSMGTAFDRAPCTHNRYYYRRRSYAASADMLNIFGKQWAQ